MGSVAGVGTLGIKAGQARLPDPELIIVGCDLRQVAFQRESHRGSRRFSRSGRRACPALKSAGTLFVQSSLAYSFQ